MNDYEFLKLEAKDLIRKDLVPKHTLSYFDDTNIKRAVIDLSTDTIKQRSCSICGITIRGPSMWMSQHMKVHQMKLEAQEKLRGEVFKGRAQGYGF